MIAALNPQNVMWIMLETFQDLTDKITRKGSKEGKNISSFLNYPWEPK